MKNRKMKDLKTGITLIVLGNVLYVSRDFFCNIMPSDLGDFILGLSLGLGVGLNVIGIILVFVYIIRKEKKYRQQ